MNNFDSWYFLLLLRRDKHALYLVEQLGLDCFVHSIFKTAQDLDLTYIQFIELLAIEQTRRNIEMVEQEIARLMRENEKD